MAPPIVTATLQTALISAFSNVLAQAITAHQSSTPFTIDPIPLAQYTLFALLSTPPNFLWQETLESAFPSYRIAPTAEALASAAASDDAALDDESARGALVEPQLSKRNTLAKFVLDQTLGAAVNTLLFSLFMHGVREGMAHHYDVAGKGKGAWGFVAGGDVVRYEAVEWVGVWAKARGEFWGLVRAGWRFWPVVSLVNYGFVKSVEARSLVGALAGLAWGVYLSLVMG